MKTKYLVFCSVIAISLSGCSKNFNIETDFAFNNPDCNIKDNLKYVHNKSAHIAFLFGQSNASGVSYNECLKATDEAKYNEYLNGYENVLINYLDDGGMNYSEYAFTKATIGCGCVNFTYGPEIGIAERMSKAYPKEKSFIIKWCWGGTALYNQWLDGNRGRGDLYNYAMDFSLKCLKYLGSKGYKLSIDGICWMQGESDSFETDWNIYYQDTIAFVSLLRDDLKNVSNNIRFIDAGINEEPDLWANPLVINKAKKGFANLSESNIYIDPTALGLTSKNEPFDKPDIYHFDSISMVKLGNAFGDALVRK